MFVSIILPSRLRYSRLIKCVRSITSSADNPLDIEFCIRIHNDDLECVHNLRGIIEAAAPAIARFVVGPPYSYGKLSQSYQDCADIAHGDWVWVMNDDVQCDSKGWDTLLRQMPADGYIVQPEMHQLGSSGYHEDVDCPFMFLPNKCWQKFGVFKFETPFDNALWSLLRRNGWGTKFLPGVKVHHDRDGELVRKERESDPMENL